MNGERLGWPFWVVGLVLVTGAVMTWNYFYPLHQPLVVQAQDETVLDATEALKPPLPPEVKQVVETVPDPSATAPATNSQPETSDPSTAQTSAPVTINYKDLMASPRLWPKAVRLKIDTEFPAMLDGKQVGTVTANAGTEVTLLKVAGEKSLLVQFGALRSTVDADTTSFEELVYATLVNPVKAAAVNNASR